MDDKFLWRNPILITWSKTFLLHLWLHVIYFLGRIFLWKVIFWGGAGKLKFQKIYEGLQLYFRRVISMHFLLFFPSVMDLPGTPGLGSSPPALWFSPPSSETQPGPPAVRWTPHQTAGGKKKSLLFVCTHVTNACVQTHRRGFASGMVPPYKRLRGTSTGTGNTPPCSLAAVYS